MTDAVALALITIIPSTVASIATVIVTVVTRRDVNSLRREVKDEGEFTRAYVEMGARHPDDLPPPRPDGGSGPPRRRIS